MSAAQIFSAAAASLALGLFSLTPAGAQEFGWAKRIGGSATDLSLALAVDDSGSVLTTGWFTGTVDFDPGPGTFNLPAPVGRSFMFISKLDETGAFDWAARMGDVDGATGRAITTDSEGGVYTTGIFDGAGDFDPGPERVELASAGSFDIFVSKLDASGQFVWARRFGAADLDEGQTIAVDANANVYVAGSFQGTVDFDPGPAVRNLTSHGSTPDGFVVKLNSAGGLVWVKKIGGPGIENVERVTVDGFGNAHVTGSFSGAADFDPGPGAYRLVANAEAAFIVKLNGAGGFLWARKLDGWGDERAEALAVDGNGDVYTTGRFSRTADFDPGPGVHRMSAVGSAVFVSKLDAQGNFVWARRMGGGGNDWAFDLGLDRLGHVYIAGIFERVADFDPGPAAFNLTSAGGIDAFVAKLDGDGEFGWAVRVGGSRPDWAFGLGLSGAGDVHASGYFNGTGDFDPGPASHPLTSAGDEDIYIVKLHAR